jgi:hypothetical protein
MKHAKLAMIIMLTAALAAPAVYAKKKVPTPAPAGNSSQNGNSSQAGGLPATNARVAALEAAVVVLRADLAAEVAARRAADTRLANALSDEIAARQAADTALANQLAAIPLVFIADGYANNIKGATVTVASKIVPAGTYFIQASVQMVNGQSSGDANARCVMRANGDIVADTSDLQFPILTTNAGPPSGAFGSTMFAPLQTAYGSTSPITILVECSESNGDNGGLNALVRIAAIKAAHIQ